MSFLPFLIMSLVHLCLGMICLYPGICRMQKMKRPDDKSTPLTYAMIGVCFVLGGLFVFTGIGELYMAMITLF